MTQSILHFTLHFCRTPWCILACTLKCIKVSCQNCSIQWRFDCIIGNFPQKSCRTKAQGTYEHGPELKALHQQSTLSRCHKYWCRRRCISDTCWCAFAGAAPSAQAHVHFVLCALVRQHTCNAMHSLRFSTLGMYIDLLDLVLWSCSMLPMPCKSLYLYAGDICWLVSVCWGHMLTCVYMLGTCADLRFYAGDMYWLAFEC